MRIRIAHETHYAYAFEARHVLQVLRLTPRPHHGQHILHWRVEPSIDGSLHRKDDAFGNITHIFSSDQASDDLRILVTGEVDTLDTGGIIEGTEERFPLTIYLRETPLTVASEEMQALARSFNDAMLTAPLDTLHAILTTLHETISFDTQPTHVTTTASEAFALKRGVCQDLSHIFLAIVRFLGIPGRYVSGYFVRSDGVIDQDAGHAWCEAYVPHLGWTGFDPTNGISTTDAHVRIAVGLDYLSAAPIRGIRIGGGSEELAVRLLVEPTQQVQSQ